MIGKNLFFKTIFSLLLSLLFSYNCYPQSDPPIDSDPNRNWDGITHWSRYIVISPGFMGPNALPVPEIKKGIIENRIEFELSQQNHFSKHDKTFNLFCDYISLLQIIRLPLNFIWFRLNIFQWIRVYVIKERPLN